MNNDYFTVEKSSDGLVFTELARIIGNGTTNTEHHYSFIDELTNSNNTYYQLTQTDFNGDKKWLGLELANCNESNDLIHIFPNPNNGSFTVSGTLPRMKITIVDVLGRVLFEAETTNAKQEINLTHLPSGIYNVQYHTTSKIIANKIVIQ